MKFIEKIRNQLGISKYELSRRIGITPQAYHSLSKATDNIPLKALIGLRREGKLSDKALLDLIEKEWTLRERMLQKSGRE
jgi:hypothetical protein